MYPDRRGLNTTGTGQLIDSPTMALRIAWEWAATGAPASDQSVEAEWLRVKNFPAAAWPLGGNHTLFRTSARLHAEPVSLAADLDRRLDAMADALRSTAHVGEAWDTLPAVAQLARLRTAWADGAGSAWPKLDAHLAAGEWEESAAECLPRDLAVQPEAYRASYRAVQALYRLAPDWPGEEMPERLPDGLPDGASIA